MFSEILLSFQKIITKTEFHNDLQTNKFSGITEPPDKQYFLLSHLLHG